MKNIIKFICRSFLILSFISLTGCDDFVEVDLPQSQLTGAAVFENESTAASALSYIYTELRETSLLTGGNGGLGNLLGLYTDELINGSGPDDFQEGFFTNSLVPNNTQISSLWNNNYHIIYSANAIIAGLEDSENIPVDKVDQYIGEALFIRGLLHFYLTNIYGDIPYVNSSDYENNIAIASSDKVTVYAHAIADLLEAKDRLEGIENTENTRIDYKTVAALLARIYLYHEEWDLAEAYSTLVIENTGWETDINDVFLIDNPGSIWEFAAQEEGLNALEARTFFVSGNLAPNRSLSPGLVTSFEEDDLRLENWVGSTGEEGEIYFSTKYNISGNTGSSLQHSIIFRVAEQYLIRAEARAKQGNLEGAQEDINKVRSRAGLIDVVLENETEAITSILEERKAELFLEFGHRFFDLKRRNLLDAELSNKSGWNSEDILFPYPENELLRNPNLGSQNPGY